MRVHVADHPLITHKLTVLRDENTPSPIFRALVEELMTLLAYEGTRGVRVEPVDIVTPVAPTTGVRIADPKPLIVPILRAGLGMLEGMVKLLPSAEVGFLGMARNEETLEPTTYAERLPEDLSDRQCFVLDPMLATGGSLTAAIEFLLARGATDVTAICILAAPEGLAAVEKALHGREVTIVLGARRRAPQRARLHRARARRRRRPPLRHGLTALDPATSAVACPKDLRDADSAAREMRLRKIFLKSLISRRFLRHRHPLTRSSRMSHRTAHPLRRHTASSRRHELTHARDTRFDSPP